MDSKLLFCTLISSLSMLSAAPKLILKLDRADALYKCGEMATFTIAFEDDKAEPLAPKATYRLTNDNVNLIKEGSIDLTQKQTLTLSETMDKPAFLRLTVNSTYTDKEGKKQGIKNNLCTAAFEPENIKPSTPNPADFLDYWKGEIAKANKECPLDAQMTKLDKFSDAQHTGYKVSFAAPGGRVYGFLNIPAKVGKLPALVCVPGAGPGVASPAVNNDFVTLQMNVHP